MIKNIIKIDSELNWRNEDGDEIYPSYCFKENCRQIYEEGMKNNSISHILTLMMQCPEAVCYCKALGYAFISESVLRAGEKEIENFVEANMAKAKRILEGKEELVIKLYYSDGESEELKF